MGYCCSFKLQLSNLPAKCYQPQDVALEQLLVQICSSFLSSSYCYFGSIRTKREYLFLLK
uniref:Uncharacterized protein n=1 Tax=Solanum lycopersicum TaxID=4081 RepID=A0A3Q7EW18_SOLLC